MTRAERAKIRNADEAAKLEGTPCAECAGVLPAHAKTCSQYVKPPVDLDDPAQQEAILNPEPAELAIGGKVVRLYPLAGRPSRKFVRLFARVMNAMASVIAPMNIKIGVTLEDNPELEAEVCRFIARAEREPGTEVDESSLDERAAQIGEDASYEELRDALDRMCELNRLAEIIAGPKTKAASAKPTS